MTSPALLTAAEIADLFRVSESTVYRWAREGDLPSVTVGSTIRFPRDAVERKLAPEATA